MMIYSNQIVIRATSFYFLSLYYDYDTVAESLSEI